MLPVAEPEDEDKTRAQVTSVAVRYVSVARGRVVRGAADAAQIDCVRLVAFPPHMRRPSTAPPASARSAAPSSGPVPEQYGASFVSSSGARGRRSRSAEHRA